MPGIQIDDTTMSEIVRLKEVVKSSVNSVMDGSLTAAHLASDVYMLLGLLDRLEDMWPGKQPIEQPVQEAPQAEQPQAEQPVQEAAPAEQPQPGQPA